MGAESWLPVVVTAISCRLTRRAMGPIARKWSCGTQLEHCKSCQCHRIHATSSGVGEGDARLDHLISIVGLAGVVALCCKLCCKHCAYTLFQLQSHIQNQTSLGISHKHIDQNTNQTHYAQCHV